MERRTLLACVGNLSAERLVIECDDADDRLQIRDTMEVVSLFEDGRLAGTWRGVETVQVDTSGGDDSLLYVGGFSAAASVNFLPSRIILVETGFGNDVAHYRGHALAHELTHTWQGGPGDDQIDLNIHDFLSDPLPRGTGDAVADASIAAQIDVDGGTGIDQLAVNWRQPEWALYPIQFDLTMTPGKAGDSGPVDLQGQQCLVFFLGGVQGSPDQPIVVGSVYNARSTSPRSPGGALHLDVDTSPDSPRVALDVLGTDGRDDVSVDIRSPVETAIAVNTAAGNDKVQVRHRYFAIVDRTHVNSVHLDLGDGHDDALVIAHRDGRTDTGSRSEDLDTLEVVARLGAGFDRMHVLSRGYRRIVTDFDTGPLGDGHDLVSGIYVGPNPSPPVSRDLASPDDGDDAVRAIRIALRVWDAKTEQTRQITIVQDL